MTISLRSIVLTSSVVIAGLTLAACGDNPTAPDRIAAPSSASFDGKAGDTGNSAKGGSIDARVLLDKSGNAVLQVYTGTYDASTNTPTPNGYFQTLQYKIYNPSGKQIQTSNVNFNKVQPTSYFTGLNLCTSKNDDDDDDDDNHQQTTPACSQHFGPGWIVSIQANLKGVAGDGNKTDVVRDSATVGFLPDIDLSGQSITAAGATGGTVPTGTATTFTVAIPNNKPAGPNGPGAYGATTTCLVQVDGILQLAIPNITIYGVQTNPNLFSYVTGPVFTIAAGQSASCQFKLTLPAGPHKIVVTAALVLPGDFDYTNNSTSAFTFTATSAPPPPPAPVDLGAGAFLINGAAPVNLVAGTQVELDQTVQLVTGTAPITATCTGSLTPVSGGATITLPNATATINAANGTALCKFTTTFANIGDYTFAGMINPPSGVTDASLTNNAFSTIVHVPTGQPSANVSVGSITFSDPSESIVLSGTPTPLTGTLGAAQTAGDSVHNKDVVTYSAPVNVALQFAPSTNVTCSVSINGTAITTLPNAQFPSFAWVNGPALNGLTSNSVCSFTLSVNDVNFQLATGNPYTIVMSVASSVSNKAPASSTTTTGVITEFVRADLFADPMQELVGTTWVDLSSNPVPQNTTVSVRTPIENPFTAPVTVSCGNLVQNVVAPISAVLPVLDIALDPALNASTTTATATIPAATASGNGVGFCTYKMTAPSTLGLISIPLLSIDMPTSGATNPQDPNPLNNQGLGTFTIKSNGQFTGLPPANAGQSIAATQSWDNSTLTTDGTQVDTLTIQGVNVTDLALLVIPAQAQLGTFTLTTTVTSGTGANAVTFGTGRVSGILNESLGGEQCDVTNIGQGAQLTGTSPAEPLSIFGSAPILYSASVCATPTSGSQQQITVDYSQSLFQPVLGSANPLLFRDAVVVKIRLDFQLTGAQAPDAVTATVTLPVRNFLGGPCSNAGDHFSCGTSFNPFTVTTP